MRSYMSNGMPCIVEAVSGEGRTGLAGFVSELKDLIRDNAAGTGAAFALAKVGPPDLWRLILKPYNPGYDKVDVICTLRKRGKQ